MANKNRRNHWESSLLAAALAVAGTMFIFDRLGSFIRNGISSAHTLVHTAPVLLIAIGVTLMFADGQAGEAGATKDAGKLSRHE